MSHAVYWPSDLPSRMARKIEVDAESGCWLWTGSCNRASGYGQVSYQGKTDLVHRVAFKLLVGEIREGFQVRHTDLRRCRHTRCCNPNRLEAVIKEESVARSD